MKTIALLLSVTAVLPTSHEPRAARVALACESGCSSADSLQVAEALRVGLGRYGVAVRPQFAGDRNLPLIVSGRITSDSGRVRVSAEIIEGSAEVARYALDAEHRDLSNQVQRMGERFARAIARP